jgi:putative transposase
MMARRVKGSRNWLKAKARVNCAHRKINIWADFLHKTTTAISKKHAIDVIEPCSIRPGASFAASIQYKRQWRRGRVVLVPAQRTSQQCPRCHHTSACNRQTQMLFCCVSCGYTDSADDVASIKFFLAEASYCETKGRTWRTLAPGGKPQPGSPVK